MDTFQGFALVNRLANHIQDTAQGLFADRDSNHIAGIADRNAPYQTLGAVHGNAAHGVFSEVLGHFEDEIPFLVADGRVCDLKRVIDRRQVAALKLNVDHRAHHLDNFSLIHVVSLISRIRRLPQFRAARG